MSKGAPEQTLEERVDGLYAVPPKEFIPAREALAAELRASGRREEAAAVKALRKPSVPAWALNQVARKRAVDVAAFLAAAARLRQAQAKGAGAGRDELEEAGLTWRDALRQLMEASGEVMTDGGHTSAATYLDRVRSTLYAAAIDDEGGELLRSGRMTTDLAPSGFEGLLGMAPEAGPGGGSPPGPDQAPTRAATAALDAAQKQADEMARRAQRMVERASRLAAAAEGAERQAREAAQAAAEAVEQADQARDELDRAQRQLGDLKA